MKTFLSTRLLCAGLMAWSVITAHADDEQDQIAVLHSAAGNVQKWAACQKLRVIGTVKAVPEVAALLTDPQLSQAARQTLEGLPYPEADAALRDALGKTSGLLKAGIVDSIGWRREAADAPLLTPLLTDTDTNVAGTSATALGRIGGPEATAALSAALASAPESIQPVVQASLLQCAEHLTANHDDEGAAAIYRKLQGAKYLLGIRTAAWRGLFFAEPANQLELMKTALSGQNQAFRRMAIKVLREANAQILTEIGQWSEAPAEARLAVVDAAVKQGSEALPIVRAAGQSQDPALRIAAWTAIGELNDLASVPALAQAAASGEKAERQAARDSLARLHGPGSLETLLAELDHAGAPEKAEILLALGGRHDAKAMNILLQNAAASDETVSVAALQSLQTIAPADALSPLLEIAQKAGSDNVRDHTMDALLAVCQAVPDKDAATRAIVEAQGHLPNTQQGEFLPLLAALGTADALTAVESASRSQNIELAKDAVRALSEWPNAGPASSLLELSHTAADPALRTLALRGAISVSAAEPDASKRMDILTHAVSGANRADEKKQILGQIGQIAAPEALELALNELGDSDVSNEALLAAVSIGEKLTNSNPKLVHQAAIKILQHCDEGELFGRAWSLRAKPGKNVPFIHDWLVCGPFSKPGSVGAKVVFNIPFGPEVRDQAVDWKSATSENHVSLAAMFPGAENCDAYLRTSVIVPDDCSGVLLTGSDDGIKAWLNGKVVLSNNTDRGDKPDEDASAIHLKKGANDLVLKVSQGGGGWSACARIVGTDGKPITDLQYAAPSAANPVVLGTE